MLRILIPVGLALLLNGPGTTSMSSCERRVCYFMNWAQYRPSLAKFLPTHIEPDLCTHLIYFGARIYKGVLYSTIWNDEDTSLGAGQYTKINNLKKKNPDLKTFLLVGEWFVVYDVFSDVASTAAKRKTFIDSAIKVLHKYKFDGLDLYKGHSSYFKTSLKNKKRFTALIEDLSNAFKRDAKSRGGPRLLLSATVSAEKYSIDKDYEVSIIAPLLDMLNVMTLDYYGAWKGKTGHPSPLYGTTEEKGLDATLNVDYSLRYWVKLGAPKEKINVGLATYGITFTLKSPSNTSVGAPILSHGTKGELMREIGILSYFEICKIMTTSGYKKQNIKEQMVPYLYWENQWVGHEDIESIRHKVAYLNANGYGGFAVKAIDMDDFNGTFCNQGKFPLINAAKEVCMTGSTDGYVLRPASSIEKDLGSSSDCLEPTVNMFFITLLGQLWVGTALIYTQHY